MSEFCRVVEEAALDAESALAVRVNGWAIALCRSGAAVFAVRDQCSHARSALSPGRVRRNVISCPLHGARFDLRTGQCLGAAYPPLATYPARIVDGWIEIAAPAPPDAPP